VVGGAEGSRFWGIAVGIAMLVVAVTSPVYAESTATYSISERRWTITVTVR
jgi:hypothetical protein